ncbi:tetratricopeptide repeat protein [Flavihumibacter sp. R14]|nr:tetratricopeptide repeat protein [Flavihumibacter soli]
MKLFQRTISFNLRLRGISLASLVVLMIVGAGAFAQSTEEAAIKNVLKDGPAAFFKRDAAAWQALWKHSPDVSQTRFNSGFSATLKGWDKVSEQAMNAIKEDPQPLPINVAQENFIIRVDNKLATAEYDQTTSNFPDEPETKFRTHQYVILEKDNNKWKVVTQVSTNPESYVDNDTNIEARMNAAGYSLLNTKKIDEAIEVLALNVKLFPNAWNTYDSLGEAYALKGNKDLAIKNYEKSMALNPKNENGIQALAKLKK